MGAKSNQASTTLLLIDNRSSVQVSSSVGSAKNYDFSIAGNIWGRGGFGGLRGFTDTPEGKVVIAAFTDSYNQMMKALRNYKPQTIEGGSGTGGALTVDGATKAVPAPKAVIAPAPAAEPVVTRYNTNTQVKTRQRTVVIDDFDEDALSDYYKALKRSVEHLGNFASWNLGRCLLANKAGHRWVNALRNTTSCFINTAILS